MSEEIKVGDVVRVSELPKIYERIGSRIVQDYKCRVVKIDDGMALLDSIPAKHTFLFPTKYLIKVEDEAKEPKFKVGDKVIYIGENQEFKGRLFEIDGEIFYNDYHRNMQVRSIKCEDYNVCNVPLSDLEPYTEPTAPTIKVGDVIDTPKGKGKVTMVADGYVIAQGDNGEWWQMITITTDKDKEFEDNIRNVLNGTDEFPMGDHIPTSIIQIGEMDWDAYTADLAKEIALKVANKYNDPTETAEYAVSVAKAVVENLKKK